MGLALHKTAAPAQFDRSASHRRAMTAKIHVAKKQLALADDDYRQILLDVAGRSSSADCTDAELEKVIKRLQEIGFKPLVKAGVTRPAQHPMARKARALWISLYHLGAVRSPDEKALESFAKRQLGCERLVWANQSDGYRLIEALKAMAERHSWAQTDANGNNLSVKRGGRVLDEFALHPDPRKLWSIAYPGITWGGSLEAISTHRGSANFFNQLVREIKEQGNPKGISLHTVTLQDALDQGFLWKLQQTLPADDEKQAMDEAAYFDFVRKGAADEESFQQEYMCRPADDDAAFLEYDLIARCEYPAGTDWEQIEDGTLFLGVDIGRKKDLTVLWLLEKLGDVFYTRAVITLQNMSKPDQEKVIWPWIARVLASGGRVAIDNTGLGIGWVDDAQDKFGKYRVEGVNFTAQSKEALAYPVRGTMEDRRLRIPHDPKIRADLRSVTKQVTGAGNIRFTAERTPDGHADRFWGLALAIHAASTPGGAPWRPVADSRSPKGDVLDLDANWIPA